MTARDKLSCSFVPDALQRTRTANVSRDFGTLAAMLIRRSMSAYGGGLYLQCTTSPNGAWRASPATLYSAVTLKGRYSVSWKEYPQLLPLNAAAGERGRAAIGYDAGNQKGPMQTQRP